MKKRRSFFYENGLSIVLFAIFLTILFAQILVGWHHYNSILQEAGRVPLTFWQYLPSGHCMTGTFENWESEFLQMYAYVLLTVYLRQRGSAESKPIGEETPQDRKPRSHKTAPWPVKKGGFVLTLYQNSLSLVFLMLTIISFILHAIGSYRFYRDEQHAEGKAVESKWDYFLGSRFWFESFQNWQSEFLAVFSIVILSVFLRQYGSPESKPVDAAHYHH